MVVISSKRQRLPTLASMRTDESGVIDNIKLRTFQQLIHEFEVSAGQPQEDRWSWLIAAHILGQEVVSLHLRTHTLMLRFALQTSDFAEASGQLLRLSLVPVGHLLGKLPYGNTGRANVSAFQPMAVDPKSENLICSARAKVIAGKMQRPNYPTTPS